jgi:hypothetical protein
MTMMNDEDLSLSLISDPQIYRPCTSICYPSKYYSTGVDHDGAYSTSFNIPFSSFLYFQITVEELVDMISQCQISFKWCAIGQEDIKIKASRICFFASILIITHCSYLHIITWITLLKELLFPQVSGWG